MASLLVGIFGIPDAVLNPAAALFMTYTGLLEEEVKKVLRKAYHDLQSSHKKFVILGGCGDGKSAIINSCKLPDEPDCKSSDNLDGQTSMPATYLCELEGDQGKEIVVLIDTPGFADNRVDSMMMVAMVETMLKLTSGKLNGIIVTSAMPIPRVGIGAQMGKLLIDLGVSTEGKWESVVVCGTQADMLKESAVASWRQQMPASFSRDVKGCVNFKVVAGYSSKYAQRPVAAPALRDLQDYSELQRALLGLSKKKVQKVLDFRPPEAAVLVAGIMNPRGRSTAVQPASPEVQKIIEEIQQKSDKRVADLEKKNKELEIELVRARQKINQVTPSYTCFDLSSTVIVQGLGPTLLRSIKPGCAVLDKDGFTRFIGFSHINMETRTKFVLLRTAGSCLRLTPTHLVITLNAKKPTLAAASSIAVGDLVLTDRGVEPISDVSVIWLKGFLGPLTDSGTLFVNGVLASCYSADIPGCSAAATHSLVHALLAPLRVCVSVGIVPPDDKGAQHWYVALGNRLLKLMVNASRALIV